MSDLGPNVTRLKPARPCPVCQSPARQSSYPFCSPRCADVDLSRWLNSAYVIPARPEEDEDEDGDKVGDRPEPLV